MLSSSDWMNVFWCDYNISRLGLTRKLTNYNHNLCTVGSMIQRWFLGPVGHNMQSSDLLYLTGYQSRILLHCLMKQWHKIIREAFYSNNTVNILYFNRLTAKCRIYPSQQEYCIRQLPDISGDICLDYIGTWRQEYFVSGVYNLKKSLILTRKPLA